MSPGGKRFFNVFDAAPENEGDGPAQQQQVKVSRVACSHLSGRTLITRPSSISCSRSETRPIVFSRQSTVSIQQWVGIRNDQSHSIAPSISSTSPNPLEPLMTSVDPFITSLSSGTTHFSVTRHLRQRYIFASDLTPITGSRRKYSARLSKNDCSSANVRDLSGGHESW